MNNEIKGCAKSILITDGKYIICQQIFFLKNGLSLIELMLFNDQSIIAYMFTWKNMNKWY